MSSILGFLGMSDREAFLDQVDREVFWQGVRDYVGQHQAELNRIYSTFVEREVTFAQRRYRLPAGGRLQESTRLTKPDAVKILGNYDIGLPIHDGRVAMGWDDVTMAYMTGEEFDAHVTAVSQQDIEWDRYKILKAILNSTNESYLDERYGAITVKRLANGDADTYPPQRIAGSTSESTRNRYVSTTYAASSISDTNNPYATARDELRKDFGRGMVASWINSAQRGKTEALTDFTPRPQQNVQYGQDTDLATPGTFSGPGEFIGTTSDVKIFVWDWIPANYIYSQDLNQLPPLLRRVDVPPQLRGFQLVAREQDWPVEVAYWRHRQGYGAGNRLNGYAQFLDAGGSYTNPSDYA
jgi:hypothetical protein